MILTAEAIQADANPIASRSLYATILRAPAVGAVIPADDSGTRAECGQGNICLGALGASDVVRVGLANSVTINGGMAARDVSIRARDDLRFTNGGTLAGSEKLVLASVTGDLVLAPGLSVEGGADVRLFAGRSIRGAGASVTAAGAVGIGTGGDLELANLSSGRLLEVADADGAATLTNGIVVPGAVRISGRLGVGPGDGRIDAASISIGALNADAMLLGASGAVTLNGATLTRGLQINAGTTIDLGGVTRVGTDLVESAGGRISAADLNAGGSVSLTGESIAFGRASAGTDMVLNGGGGISADDLTVGRNVGLVAANGGILLPKLIVGGSIDAVARDITIASPGALTFARASATGNLTIGSANGLSATLLSAGGTMDLSAVTGAIKADISAAGPVTARARAITIGARSATRFTQVTSTAGGMALNGGANDLTIDAASATGGALVINAGQLRAVSLTGSQDVTIAAGNILFDTLIAGGNAGIAASAGSVNGGTLTGRRTVSVDGVSGVGIATLTSGGTTGLTAANGSVAVTNDLISTGAVTARGRAVDLTARAGLTVAVAQATAGDIGLRSGAALSLDQANASGALRIVAAGAASFSGVAFGQTISVASGDIAIGTGARIGTAGSTTSLSLSATDNRRATYIGGSDTTAGYSLSADEIGRLAARNISVTAGRVDALQQTSLGSARAPDVFVRGFTLNAGANGVLASDGTLTIATPGKLRVEGAVQINGLAATGGLSISAGEALEVIAGAGSIDLRDGNKALGGVLTLDSPDIIAATTAAIADVAAAQTLDARERRLAQNDGVVSEDGILRAGTIRARAANGLYIQNTAASTGFTARRGFTANAFDVTGAGSGTQIAINGRLLRSTGAFATGLQTIPLVSINGTLGGVAGQYATGSKINGCLIASPGSCAPSSGFDVGETLNGAIDPTVAVGRLFSLALVELRDFVAEGYPPLIDEPVTGAGNDDLWERQCGDPGEASCSEVGTQ